MIRPATIDDAEAIAALTTQLGYPVEPEALRTRLRALPPSGTVLVAERAGRVIGWIHIAEVPILTSDHTARILGLVVDNAHRGRGIGRALLAAAEAWAHDAGAHTIIVKSALHRPRAHAFYRRAAFEVYKDQRVFVRTLSARLPR